MQPRPPGSDDDDDEQADDTSDDSSDAGTTISSSGSESESDASDASETEAEAEAEVGPNGTSGSSMKESLEHYQEARREVLAAQQSLLTHNGCLLRSKGFVWLASCDDRVVEWSSSGLLLEVCMSHPWFCTVSEVRL